MPPPSPGWSRSTPSSAPHGAGDHWRSGNGKAQFGQRAVCHSAVAGQPDRIGPNLVGVYGSKAATQRPKFAYSSALKASKLTWADATLDKCLANPAAAVPGTKMVFAGLPSKTARQNMIAYLKTLK